MSDATEPKEPESTAEAPEAQPTAAAEAPEAPMAAATVAAEAPAATTPAATTAEAPAATTAEAPVALPSSTLVEPQLAIPAPEVAAMPPVVPAADELDARRRRPTYVFFGVLAAISLLADISTKAWAEVVLSKRTALDPSIVVLQDHLSFTLAYNRGGAWGLLHDASENVRRPFFLLVSVLAIAFIVSLYSRLAPTQRALKWGLPLVLGGALGNLSDRITRSSVIDFIDYRADWIEKMNQFIAKYSKGWAVTDHWPTFNVADVFICIGVALMAVDMMTSRRTPAQAVATAPLPGSESPATSTELAAPTAEAAAPTAEAAAPTAETAAPTAETAAPTAQVGFPSDAAAEPSDRGAPAPAAAPSEPAAAPSSGAPETEPPVVS